ncbi:hypothetical protein BCR44DRAFT_1442929 [Catenaria anguillulae PL171]|uniref:Uncharacterized protein n=1 Tax=Catenaria anguillulae PL171 TaxID=765915 RepID=A0A1Y2H9E2_9FUNG|nr:hypothetical protein BCR44DRAFT_1442929 [Catenaria anguillulae PL171]
MMSTANTAQEPQSQPQSKILDADFDAASILSQSALLSRHCADRSEHAGIDCYKICRTHADVAQLASTLLITIGTQSLHTNTAQEDQDRPFHIRADTMIKSLDLAPLLSLVQETAKRARTVCSAHIDCSHCQACSQSAAQVEVVVHSLLSKEAAKHAGEKQQHATESTATLSAKGKRATAQQHHDVHEKREAEMKHEQAQTPTQTQPTPAGKSQAQAQQQQDQPQQAHGAGSTKKAQDESTTPSSPESPPAQTTGQQTGAQKRNPRRKSRGGGSGGGSKYSESFKGGQHEHTAQAMVAAESTLGVAGDRGSGESHAAGAASSTPEPRARRPSMHEAFPLGTAEGQKYDTEHEIQSWAQMQEQGLGGGLELGTAEGQKVGAGSGLHGETGAPGGGGVQLGSIEAADQADTQRVHVKEE